MLPRRRNIIRWRKSLLEFGSYRENNGGWEGIENVKFGVVIELNLPMNMDIRSRSLASEAAILRKTDTGLQPPIILFNCFSGLSPSPSHEH